MKKYTSDGIIKRQAYWFIAWAGSGILTAFSINTNRFGGTLFPILLFVTFALFFLSTRVSCPRCKNSMMWQRGVYRPRRQCEICGWPSKIDNLKLDVGELE